ncbi:MAG: phage portal protein [Bacteroidales bacterium]|nr:phage portal protein [Bacteroidales bacterium]MBQ6290881.1 phage portal protein [Bacteroidales bacterium]
MAALRKIDEILALPDIGQRIAKLKEHRGHYTASNPTENLKLWDPEKHDIMDKEKFPDEKVLVEKGKVVIDAITKQSHKTEDKYDTVEINRITLPLEQDVINIQTAFTVGNEPKTICETDDEGELRLLKALKYTFKRNFCKYLNKKIVRSWLSEQEVAEYWYAAEDKDGFWSKIWRTITKALTGTERSPQRRPKCVIWSPFRGDELVPFMENDKMTGFLRGYKQKDDNNTEIQCYMCITDTTVYEWTMAGGEWQEKSFKHGCPKLPVNYLWRKEMFAARLARIRARIEKTLSQYADCIDYHFFPYLVHFGEATNVQGKKRNHTIQVTGSNAKAPMYLTWDQVPDTVKFEVTTDLDLYYSLGNTPRISFDQLKGTTPASGEAFKFYFMGAHMAVENHFEELGPFFQRRVNIVTAFLGAMNAELLKPSRTADISVEGDPYMIDSISEKVTTAVAATGGPVWTKRSGVAFVGNIDNIDEEVKQLEEQEEKKAELQASAKGTETKPVQAQK